MASHPRRPSAQSRTLGQRRHGGGPHSPGAARGGAPLLAAAVPRRSRGRRRRCGGARAVCGLRRGARAEGASVPSWREVRAPASGTRGVGHRDLDVIVVAYGPVAAVAETLDTLGPDASVVVVDNASSPATRDAVTGAGARYVDPGRNLGFAAAVNLAMTRLPDTDADVLLLNPDARITPGELEHLHAELRARPRVACVAPLQHHPGSGAPSRAHWPWHTPWGAWAEAIGLSRRRLDSER